MIIVQANGASIPALGFGTWELRGATARRLVEGALEIGYRHVDTAQMYGNEAEVGAAIRASGLARGEVFLTTKIWPDQFKKAQFERAVDDSLARLGLDRVDLLLLHWPSPTVPLAETLEALNDARAAGKTRHIGISNFTIAMVEEAVRLSPAPIVTNQVEYQPYLSQRRLLRTCREHGLALTAYCPLARGRIFQDETLQRIGARHGRDVAQVTLRWLVQQEGVVAIPRSSREENARSNFAIFDFALSEPEMAEIHGLARPGGRVVSVGSVAPAWDEDD